MDWRPLLVKVHAINVVWSRYALGWRAGELASMLLSHAGNARAKSGSNNLKSGTRLHLVASRIAIFSSYNTTPHHSSLLQHTNIAEDLHPPAC
jgi:hypothetical protein